MVDPNHLVDTGNQRDQVPALKKVTTVGSYSRRGTRNIPYVYFTGDHTAALSNLSIPLAGSMTGERPVDVVYL
jgi:hypothetical protein